MKNYRKTLNFILAVNLAVSVLSSSEWTTMLVTMTAMPPALLFVS